jgi:hypothetical protein
MQAPVVNAMPRSGLSGANNVAGSTGERFVVISTAKRTDAKPALPIVVRILSEPVRPRRSHAGGVSQPM